MLKYPINVTIDTNIFDAAKYDFSDNSTLQLLIKYVQEGKVKIVLSNIVIKESEKHIAEQGLKLCSTARKLRAEALKLSTENLVEYVGLKRLLELVDDRDVVRKRSIELFEKYIKDIDAEILDTSQIDLDAILDDYFEIRPPFESSDKKRKEFPDAFIANQIRERFGSEEMVAIISNDKGFKAACKEAPNHLFFDSLAQLYNEINKEETAYYNETIEIISELQSSINSDITEYVTQNEIIDVIGISHDKDGNAEGHDYSEVSLNSIANTSFIVHSIDELTANTSILTIICVANISVDCFYDDYAEQMCDSRIKEYVYVETVSVREEHHARFGCRLKLNRETKKIEILPFRIILGGDSRKKRYQLDHNLNMDYEKEIINMNRKSIGLRELGSYGSYLEEDLPNSKMSEDLIKRFRTINNLHHAYGDFLNTYDLLFEKLNEIGGAKKVIKFVSKKLEEISDFPGVLDEDEIDEEEIEEIKRWTELKLENVSRIIEKPSLPDTFSYGESISIKGVDDSEMILCIDELYMEPSIGEEVSIDITLSDEKEIIASGVINLTVGYLDYDEDGGVADGTEDHIQYYGDQIIKEMDNFILQQNKQVSIETGIVKIIEEALKVFN